MKFVDQVQIFVKGGNGGNGAVAFHREKYIDKGGPSGGDGGDGGSIIFEADPQLTTLLDFRFSSRHEARSGAHGMGSDMNGRAGEDTTIKVPLGTLVRDDETGELLKDLSTPGELWVVAKGGSGGWGNMNFATATRQTPRFAKEGTLGQERKLMLELKLLADVGLLGFPNAGKSTFISRISAARPKVADYPFTTLVPNLGVVDYRERRSFVVADIPGLIEGASDGHGLGLQFLRHVERCRVLIHLVDLSAADEGRSPVKDFDILNRELEKYSALLADKPQIVVANKLDLPHAREALPAFAEAMAKRNVKVFELSGATGEGAQAVLDACARILFANEEHKVRLKGRHLLTEGVANETTTAKASRPKRAPAKKKVAPKKVVAAKKPTKKSALEKSAPMKKGGKAASIKQIDAKALRQLKHDKKKLTKRKSR
ncbi:MAG: GTPase ObgE [Archangium sp.]|nr:GTPase ObgE [Archangium sp.]MDP3157261.1 GTPase ObgE [Archangium sp.]MDP3576228.1 GTPase ObgE [Archangium sp.]